LKDYQHYVDRKDRDQEFFMDRIDAMRAFVAVATEGSFTRAAEVLDLSPQLVSKYVSQLEERLAVRLLNRTTRKVSLAEAGALYFQHAQQVLADIDDMELQLGNLQQEARGTLRISAPVSFAIRHLARLVADFQAVYPLVDIDLQLNDRKVDIVEEGFDVALRIGHLKSSSLVAKRLAPVRLIWCASPAYLDQHGKPDSLEEMKHHRYLHYSYTEMDGRQETYQWLRTRSEGPPGALTSNNGDVLVEAAIAGAGIALQPSFIAGAAIGEGKLKQVLPEYEPAPLGLYAVYTHRKLLASKVRCFIDFIAGYFDDPPYWDRFGDDT
jgi:DNA-binding transcriptional LysR family regulator